jgi:hypothetical protein
MRLHIPDHVANLMQATIDHAPSQHGRTKFLGIERIEWKAY